MAKVLVVDDVSDNVKLLSYELEDHGHTVLVAYNGEQALTMARSERPDVILLDVMMPVMDGIETCRRLKQDPETEPIPVIMVSARDQEADVMFGLEAGAQDYVTKPFNSQVVAARVRTAARSKAAYDELETRVRERTAMLSEVNAALTASERRYRFLADAMPQLVWTARPDGYLDYYNERWYEFTGMPRGEDCDPSWEPVIHPDDRQMCKDSWNHSIRTGEPYQIEYRFLDNRTGEYRWHLGRAMLVRSETGEGDHWVGTCTDIVEQKRAEKALRQAYDEVEMRVRERTAELALANESLQIEVAERSRAESEALKAREVAETATRAKGEFLANMSHEIRTPMNGILGMTELALETTQDPRQKEYLGLVKSSAEALLTIINDILDFSKIEAGKLDLDTVPFRLRDLIADTLAVLAPRAHAKPLKLIRRIAPEVPDALIGDPGRIRQVILNLVGNAIKFTESGEVVVSVELQPDGKGPGSLRFSIADTGIGIPVEKRMTIFEPFEQADGSTTRKYGGTGLGLSISAKLVALMGGRIWVEGAVGQGSIFLFDAELGLDSETAQRDHGLLDRKANLIVHDLATTRPLRILLADDHPINQKVAAGLLERMGHAVTVVADGRAALQAWREGRFDLILMDIQMPEMDGFETLAAIRAIEQQSGNHGPIVALTAHAMSGDRERCLKAGFDEYLSKPIRSDRLREVIESLANSAVVQSQPVVEPISPAEPEFDPAAALDCVGGNPELLVEIMHLFFDDCPRLLAEMNSAISRSDASTLMRRGHTLRGMAGNFAMTAVVDAASRLESMGKAEELGAARAALEELSEAIERVRPALDLFEHAGCITP